MKPWKATRVGKGRIWLGIAAVFYSLCVVALTSPSSPPSSGRWAWLHGLSASAFGTRGDIALYAILGTACLVAGLVHLKADK